MTELIELINNSDLSDWERSNLIRMLERAAHRGADIDRLIEECIALTA